MGYATIDIITPITMGGEGGILEVEGFHVLVCSGWALGPRAC